MNVELVDFWSSLLKSHKMAECAGHSMDCQERVGQFRIRRFQIGKSSEYWLDCSPAVCSVFISMIINGAIPVSMWDQRYSRSDFVYGTEPNDFLKSFSNLIPSRQVLCLGDGEGRNGVYLAQQGFEVTSVDCSAVGLNKARMLADQRGVTIQTQVADLENYQIGQNKWDAVVSIFCHLPVVTRCAVHQQVVAGLRPGGLFILEAYTPDQVHLNTGGPRTVDLMVTLSALKSELSGLEFDHAIELTREIHEGVLHDGLSAVVQLIARKPS